MATFKHAIAVQATEEQIGQFRLMIKSTEAARRQAHDLQQLGSNASDSEDLISKATSLQGSVEEAHSAKIEPFGNHSRIHRKLG